MATLYRALEKVLIIAESRDFRIPKIISISGRNRHGCEFVEFWGLPPLIPLLQYVNKLGFEICFVNRMNNRARKLGYVNLNWSQRVWH